VTSHSPPSSPSPKQKGGPLKEKKSSSSVKGKGLSPSSPGGESGQAWYLQQGGFRCCLCSSSLSSKGNLRVHIQHVHGLSPEVFAARHGALPEAVDQFVCQICEAFVCPWVPANIKRHLENTHFLSREKYGEIYLNAVAHPARRRVVAQSDVTSSLVVSKSDVTISFSKSDVTSCAVVSQSDVTSCAVVSQSDVTSSAVVSQSDVTSSSVLSTPLSRQQQDFLKPVEVSVAKLRMTGYVTFYFIINISFMMRNNKM
jgi:hypothetical protein